MKKEIEGEWQLLKAAEEVLGELPGVKLLSKVRQLSRSEADAVYDGEVRVEVRGHAARLVIEARRKGYPSDLRDAVWRLVELRKLKPNRQSRSKELVAPLIVSPFIPQSSRDFLQQQEIGYIDFSGSVYLPLPHAFFLIDRPPKSVRSFKSFDPEADGMASNVRKSASIYKGNTTQVLQVLLCEHERGWRVTEAAELAGVSPSTAHGVFTALEQKNFVERSGNGPQAVRRLIDPAGLLDEWAEHYTLKQYKYRYFYRWAQSSTSLRQTMTRALEEQAIDYALTLTSGAELVAPFATATDRLSVVVPLGTDLAALAQTTRLKSVEDGANIAFLLPRSRTPLMLRQRLDDAWVASDVQLYLDLFSLPARGKEQAKHLRAARLKF